jgi:hypothetical protein
MQLFTRFHSNSTYKNSNKELACFIKQAKQLVCFTNKQNKRSSEIIEYKRSNKNNLLNIQPVNRSCFSCRHNAFQDMREVCTLFGFVNYPNKTITYETVENSRKNKNMCTPIGIYFEKGNYY